jgi:type IV pilus assembly protein PilA
MSELNSIKTAISECAESEGALTNCTTLGSNGIPSWVATEFINGTPTINSTTGAISATSYATASSGGAALTIVLTPAFTAGAANIAWTNSGTICNPTRGLKSGAGGCS